MPICFVRLADTLTRHVALVIIAFSAIALAAPATFAWATSYTSLFLGIIMFGMGLTIDAKDFRVVFTRPKEVAIGAVVQFSAMPLLAALLIALFGLEGDLAIGVVLVACCPGGTASNVITYIAKGDVALSVAMTIVSTLLAPIVTPTLVYLLAGAWVEVSFASMCLQAVQVVLVPVLAGIAVGAFGGKRVERASALLPVVSVLAIAVIVAGIMAANAGKLAQSGLLVLCVVALHNAFGMMAGWLAGRVFKLDYAKTTAVAIEIGLQNSGLAVTLAAASFAANPLATLPGAVFSIWQNIAGSFFAQFRRRRAPKLER